MTTQPRTCLLVEDNPDTRVWPKARLDEAFAGIVITEAACVRDARTALARSGAGPDLALVDLALPDGSGVDVIRLLTNRHSATLPVVATIYDDDAHLFEAISAGARGYLLKHEEPAMIAGYLRRIAAGEPPLSPSVAHRILGHFRSLGATSDDEARLSAREAEVLGLLARGMTVAQAARALGLQPQTVASYVKVIYQKLNVSSRAEATLAAARRGLV